jgi:hypothetical protein
MAAPHKGMNNMKNALYAAASAIALLAGAPAFAEDAMDASKMTCKDMGAMDEAGMMHATTAIKEAAMKDEMADKAKMEMSDADMMKMIEKACDGKPDMMAMDAMHGSM